MSFIIPNTPVSSGGGSGNTTTARATVASDVGVSGTTLSNTTGLSFAIAANETWLIEVAMTYTSAATGGIKVGASLPTGATGRLSITEESTSATTAPQAVTTTSITTGASPTFLATSTGGVLSAFYTIVNGSTAGTVQIQHAETSAAGTTTVLANSYMIATKV